MGNMLKISKIFIGIAFSLFILQIMCFIPMVITKDGSYWASMSWVFIPFEFLVGWGAILIDIIFNNKSK